MTHPFDLLPEPHAITLDKCYRDPPPMTRECAIQIITAEKRWGKGTMRPELLAEAKKVLHG